MRIDLDNWEDEFSSAVLYRGRDYAQEGHVQAMMVVGSTIHAKVRGNWLYDVTIGMDGHTITHMDCTCPYAEDGSYCKHMAAVLYEYERRQTDILVQPSESTLTPKQLDYQKIINHADPKLVHSFLIDLLKTSNDLTLDFLNHIHYGYNHENVSIITDSIDRLIRCVDYYHDWDRHE